MGFALGVIAGAVAGVVVGGVVVGIVAFPFVKAVGEFAQGLGRR